MINHRLDTTTMFTCKDDCVEKLIEIPESDVKKGVTPETSKVAREPYVAEKQLVDAVNIAIALGRPLLIQGEPGCGKTRLAHAVAFSLGLPLEKCYIKSTTCAQEILYTIDHVKRLYDAQLGDKSFKDMRNYVSLGPLGRAIKRACYGRRSVVLIDEVDKADIDFPNDLLHEFDCLEFTIKELNEHYSVDKDKPELRPIIIITNNEEKPLPTAFLRRCIFYYLEFPKNEETILKILKEHDIMERRLSERAIKVFNCLRQMQLTKKPGLSELIDWLEYLDALNYPFEDVEKFPHMEILIKQRADLQKIEKIRKEVDKDV